MLISVSGIGPKTALAILSLASADTLKRAIAGGDAAYLTKVSGIGKKMPGRSSWNSKTNWAVRMRRRGF